MRFSRRLLIAAALLVGLLVGLPASAGSSGASLSSEKPFRGTASNGHSGGTIPPNRRLARQSAQGAGPQADPAKAQPPQGGSATGER